MGHLDIYGLLNQTSKAFYKFGKSFIKLEKYSRNHISIPKRQTPK